MKPVARAMQLFEIAVILALKVFLVVVTALAVVILWRILWLSLPDLRDLSSVPSLQLALQHAFSGVLLVLLGLELLETMNIFEATHHVRLQVILAVAVIAVGRHIMVMDLAHSSGTQALGVAVLVMVLVGGYYLLGLKARPAPGGEADKH